MLLERNIAFELLNQHVKNEKMIAHCLASEAVMRAIARRLGKDEDKWGQAGLLHDLDVEDVHGDSLVHGIAGAEMLKAMGLDEDVTDAIKMHNEAATGLERSTEFQHALAAGETITGLIMATTFVYPDKKITSIKTKSVTKRMKEKNFAASVKRENILECELIGIPINDFAELSIAAMTEIADKIGL